MLPISTSRPPRRRLLSAASVALGSCAPPTMSKACAPRPLRRREELGVGFDISRKRDAPDARTAESRERIERRSVPSGRDDTPGAERKRKKYGCASIGARRARHDDRFTRGEPPTQKASIGHRNAAERKVRPCSTPSSASIGVTTFRNVRISASVPSRQCA